MLLLSFERATQPSTIRDQAVMTFAYATAVEPKNSDLAVTLHDRFDGIDDSVASIFTDNNSRIDDRVSAAMESYRIQVKLADFLM